jgi:hypothetical protein
MVGEPAYRPDAHIFWANIQGVTPLATVICAAILHHYQ